MNHAAYLSRIFTDLPATSKAVIRAAKKIRRMHPFDCVAATGLSGTLMAPILANELRCGLVVVRKPEDVMNHSGRLVECSYNCERYLFLDDQICSGLTWWRVADALTQLQMEPAAILLHSDPAPWESAGLTNTEHLRRNRPVKVYATQQFKGWFGR